MVRAGAIPQLLGLLQSSSSPALRRDAAYALNLCTSTATHCASVAAECIAAGAVPILLHTAGAGNGSSGSTREQRAAVSVLARLACSSGEY